MSKNKKALICNIIILILEIIGFSLFLYRNHSIPMEYYTMDSNLLALISSILFITFYKTKKKEIQDLRFITTSCLTVTFLVVIFILVPMANFNFKALMFDQEFLIFHTLCPIISIISYVFYEKRSTKEYLGFFCTIIYSIILIILNLTDIVVGPYPFLKIKEQSIFMSLVWSVLILVGSYYIGKTLNYLNKQKEEA